MMRRLARKDRKRTAKKKIPKTRLRGRRYMGVIAK
jgi:hypothetical protein